MHAITRAVSEKGYAKVTVADVVSLAGVSRRTFYEHFKDVEDCFVAAYEPATRALLAEVEPAVRATPSSDWHERFEVVDRRLSAGAQLRSRHGARVPGRRPRRRARAPSSRAATSTRNSCARCARCATPAAAASYPEVQFRAAVGAIGELVQEHIVDRGADSLAELTPTLVRVGWALLERPATAGR